MMRKWPIILLVIALLTIGCSSSEAEKTNNNNNTKGDVTTEIKNLKGAELAKKVGSTLEAGNVDKAIQLGEAAIKKEPKNLGAALNLSNAYFYKKDYKNMLRTAQSIEKQDPNNPYVLNQVAYALIESGVNPAEGIKKVDKAARILLKAGKEVDRSIVDTFAYGLYKTGKKKEAIDTWKDIIAQSEEGDIYFHLGQAMLDIGQKKAAKVYFEQGIKMIKLTSKDANISEIQKQYLKEVQQKIEKQLVGLKDIKV